jgi:hypothetical protein
VRPGGSFFGGGERCWLIGCKRIYNFWCSKLVLHQFIYMFCSHFIALLYFPALTY